MSLKITVSDLKNLKLTNFFHYIYKANFTIFFTGEWILDMFIYVTWENVGVNSGSILFSILGPFFNYFYPSILVYVSQTAFISRFQLILSHFETLKTTFYFAYIGAVYSSLEFPNRIEVYEIWIRFYILWIRNIWMGKMK